MPDYLVTWEIDVFNVRSPLEAARKAREAQVREATMATVFIVTNVDQGITTQVDLMEEGEAE
jgi:hypothetical protein